MFGKTREKTTLEQVRDDAVLALADLDPQDPDYKKTYKIVDRLSTHIANERRELLSPNTVAVVLGNLGVAVVVVAYEQRNVITTKVVPFLMKVSS